MTAKNWFDTVADAELRATFQRPDSCDVCGLKVEQLPPTLRLLRNGKMLCNHAFGVPAENVPDYSTHNPDGTPYGSAR